MQTKLSTKGQVVLPSAIRRKLGLRAGDPLEASVEGGQIVLSPRRGRLRKPRIGADPITGLPVLVVDPGAPPLTSEQLREILSDFP
jgi:AbrB family looped-hinge helix DNA binding protein